MNRIRRQFHGNQTGRRWTCFLGRGLLDRPHNSSWYESAIRQGSRAAIAAFLLILTFGSFARAQAPALLTITGYVYDNNGNPLIGTPVNEYPLNPTLIGSTLVGPNVCNTQTGNSGAFSLSCVGNTYALLSIPAINAVIKAQLGTGTITLAQLEAQQQNVVTSAFPPTGNLNMGGFSFLNMAGATQNAMPVVKAAGLGEATVFSTSGTYNVPVNASMIHAIVIAGGGGGGGGNSSSSNGGGGGGGPQTVACMMLPVNGNVTVTVGVAGTGGTATNPGTNGTDSIVAQSTNASLCDAGPGDGGTAGGGSVGTGGTGGSSGTAANANFVGAVIEKWATDGGAGNNGNSGSGGAGAGLSQFGGIGGAPSGGAGLAGINGTVLMWSD